MHLKTAQQMAEMGKDSEMLNAESPEQASCVSWL